MRLFFNLLILLILILNFSCTIQGQKNNQNKGTNRENTFTWKKDSSLIEALFERYSGEQAGVSFVVIQDGEILAKKSYGYADLKNRIIATEHTNYRTASATKQFTAMAIMMLIHQKKISYSSKLTDIFDDFPEYGNKITVKHLLVHRSGLVDYMNLLEENRSDQILDPEVLSLMKSQDKTLFEPGSMYEYSNSGYAVLSEIISKVSGLPFAEYMRNNIFEPLGMMNTFVYEKGVTIPNRAYGYTKLGRSFRKTDQSTTSAVQGDGGIYTSVADYQKWAEALTNNQLIPSKEFEEALIAVYDNPVLNVQKYGHGWRIDYVNGIKKTTNN